MNENTEQKVEETKPNEVSGLIFSSGIKIIDPETQEVLIHIRDE